VPFIALTGSGGNTLGPPITGVSIPLATSALRTSNDAFSRNAVSAITTSSESARARCFASTAIAARNGHTYAVAS